MNELDQSRALLAAIVDSSDDAIVSKSLDGVISSWNRGAVVLFGYEPQEIIGKHITTIIPLELRSEETSILAQLRAGQKIDHFETVRLTKDGRRVEVSITVSPIRDLSGTIVGASKVARDISDRKRIEQQLRDADRRKDEFLAMLGHELRNPLAPIRNITEILRQHAASDPAQAHMCEVLDRQVKHMTRLLDDLLDVTRIRQGKIKLHLEAVDVLTVVARAVEGSRPFLDARHHKLRVEVPSDELRVMGDVTRLVQMLGNLLNNAAKYTPEGSEVRVSVSREKDSVAISVKDSGAGISPAMLPVIFDMFVQAEQTMDRAQGGLGIGLTLVRKIAELHTGKVQAFSEGLGKGSEFVVTLPLHHLANDLASDAPSSGRAVPTGSRNILVVDDNADACESLAILLRFRGHSVRTAATGQAAVECVRHATFQLVVLDIGLPDLNGYQVAQRLRQDGYRGLLVALTGYGQPDDRERAIQSGFDRHFVKPVDPLIVEGLLHE